MIASGLDPCFWTTRKRMLNIVQVIGKLFGNQLVLQSLSTMISKSKCMRESNVCNL